MNTWQHARQLRYLIESQAWTDGAAEPVFAAVRVTTGQADAALRNPLRMPFVLITPTNDAPDPEEGELEEQSFDLTIVQEIQGGDVDQAVLMGGPRTGGQGSSKGRGLLELGEELKKAVARLTGTNGMRAVCAYSGATAVQSVSGGNVGARKYQVRVWGTTRRHYEAHRFVTLTALGGGVVRVAWTLAPARWDRLSTIVRYAVGSTAPASASAGTDVPVPSATQTSVDVSGLAAGATSFAVFAAYDETGGGSAERYSDQEVDTYATVTVT